MSKKCKVWEAALAIGVLTALVWGFWAQGTQQALSEKLVRLHVVANSDSESDQALKQQVRDRTLTAAGKLLDGASDAGQAEQALIANLPYIRREAQNEVLLQGYDYPVSVTLDYEEFPTRDYDGFSLPAGRYQALRVTIGAGGGQNWWCVVFPPLCEAAASGSLEDAAALAGLTSGDVALIAEQDGLQLKFKCVELWEELRQRLNAR